MYMRRLQFNVYAIRQQKVNVILRLLMMNEYKNDDWQKYMSIMQLHVI